jgi:hypothetical protein
VAQPGSASALGAEGRGFESLRPDQRKYIVRAKAKSDAAPLMNFPAVIPVMVANQ